MNILFLDSDEYYHQKFKEHMSSLGKILIKSNTDGIAKIIKDFQPHVLVSELMIDDKTLYEILDEINAEALKRKFPIFIYSKTHNLEDLGKTLELGVSGYLVKGKDSIENLKSLILSHISYAQ